MEATHLTLSWNLLSTLPHTLFDNLTALEMLDISYNQIRVLPSDIETLVNLKASGLGSCLSAGMSRRPDNSSRPCRSSTYQAISSTFFQRS